MADDLRYLAPELGVSTADLRRAIGPGWIRRGEHSVGFNVTRGPAFLDRSRKPRVLLRVTNVYFCTPNEDGTIASSRELTIATPIRCPEGRTFRWDATNPMGSLPVERDPDERESWLERLSNAVHSVHEGSTPQGGFRLV